MARASPMITDEIERNLVDLYWVIYKIPAWIPMLQEAGFNSEEILFMERVADEYDGLINQKEIDFFKEENTDSNENKIKILFRKIYEEHEYTLNVLKRGKNLADLHFQRNVLSVMERAREKLLSTIYFKKRNDGGFTDSVSDAEIVKARSYPLNLLLKNELKAGRMPCPFHNGKDNNFMVKETGYCFVCQEWCDSIKYLMQIKGLKFPDAIKAINSL